VQLAAWLQRLVVRLQAAGGAVAAQLVATVAGRGARLVVDDARLALDATVDAAGALDVRIVAAEAERPAQVVTTGATLRDIVDGRRLLDAAVADGTLEMRAPLAELLALHELVQMAIARAPADAALRALWAEFDAQWPRAEAPVCAAIDRQDARHGDLRRFVPEAVRLARSPIEGPGGGAAPP
jgi:hypothetical protein